MKKLILFLLIVAGFGCTQESGTEKHQNKRDNVIDVRTKVKELKIDDVLISRSNLLYFMGDYLIISDYKSYDKLIHLFNKNSFEYITSVAQRGQGPGEISNMGHIGINEVDRIFYVSDHGKQQIFSYELDSVLMNPDYLPSVKLKMDETLFPSEYHYINDTLSIGRIIKPIGNTDFKPYVGKWNMSTGEIKLMPYEHPEIKKKRIDFAVSMENGIYVECYYNCDLMTICDLNGNLKYNVYGKNWDDGKVNRIDYYKDVAFCGDKIVALYSGENAFSGDKSSGLKANLATKFHVFDIDGNYIKTLETGYRISEFLYDKENNRILMDMDDVMQFAYLDLDGLIG